MKKNLNANAKKSNLEKINLSGFKKKSEKMQFSEKSPFQSREEIIYLYPLDWDKYKINGIEGKGFRNSCRNKLMNFAELIGLYLNKNRIEDMQNELKKFMQFYKEKYRLQDFDISHFSSIRDEIKREKISLLLDIAKEYFGKDIAKKSPAKKESPAKKSPEKIKESARKRRMNKDAKKGKSIIPIIINDDAKKDESSSSNEEIKG